MVYIIDNLVNNKAEIDGKWVIARPVNYSFVRMENIMKCPKCGSELKIREWFCSYGREEIIKECLNDNCDYFYHWAFGNVVADSEDDYFTQIKS